MGNVVHEAEVSARQDRSYCPAQRQARQFGPLSLCLDATEQYTGKLHVGYQSLAYLAEGEQGVRMGDPRRTVANFVRGHGEYWELWDGNGRDPVICNWLLDEIERVRSQGTK
jgi:hypothetical protein